MNPLTLVLLGVAPRMAARLIARRWWTRLCAQIPVTGTEAERTPGDNNTVPSMWLAPHLGALALRYSTSTEIAENIQVLSRVDQLEHIALEHVTHGYLVGCLSELGEAHTACAVPNCPTCRTLGQAVSVILAEIDVRHTRSLQRWRDLRKARNDCRCR